VLIYILFKPFYIFSGKVTDFSPGKITKIIHYYFTKVYRSAYTWPARFWNLCVNEQIIKQKTWFKTI